jgi:hypothetical protein
VFGKSCLFVPCLIGPEISAKPHCMQKFVESINGYAAMSYEDLTGTGVFMICESRWYYCLRSSDLMRSLDLHFAFYRCLNATRIPSAYRSR